MRKNKDRALSDISDDMALKLEFLWRNPVFKAEVDELNRMPTKQRRDLAARQKATETFQRKWGLETVLFPITSPIATDRNLIRLPVRALSLSGEKLTLEIDLACPAKDVLPIVENLLGGYREAKGRRRLDEAQKQIEYYDAWLSGKSYEQIALALNRPVSTVKSAVRAAFRKIHGDVPYQGKNKARLIGFNPQTHFQTCRECRDNKICAAAEQYASQDSVAQREKTGVNLDYAVRKTRG